MKITDVHAYAFWAGFRNVCIVKVETDCGIYGWVSRGLAGVSRLLRARLIIFGNSLSVKMQEILARYGKKCIAVRILKVGGY